MTTHSRSNWARARTRVGALLVIAALGVALGSGGLGDRSAADGLDESAGAVGTVGELDASPEAATEEVAVAAAGLGLDPATGSTDTEPVSVTIPAPCPTTEFLVTIRGGGFGEGANVIGLTTIEDPAATSFNAGGTWATVAGNNPGTTTPLEGTADLTLICVGASPATEYTGQVTFTPTGSGVSSFQLLSGGGEATPTPSPSPTATPTPSPTPTQSPTPSPSESPTPTPSGSPTPTPDVSPTPCPTGDEQCDAGTDGDNGNGDPGDSGALPDSGGDNPRTMLLTAAMLGLLGIALLLFEAAARPREDLRW